MKVNRIVFVCHGNICRSTMAEFVMKDIVNKAGRSSAYRIESRAVSTEEIGSPIHHGTRAVLEREGIPYDKNKTARQITREDYDRFDLIVIMDENNNFNLKMRIGGAFYFDHGKKIHMLMEYLGKSRDVLDPWYTGDFEATYRDVSAGCKALFEQLEERYNEEN